MSVEYLATPDKSENDKKEYKLLRLPNGMTALLVADPSPVPEEELSSESSDSENDSVAEESDEEMSVESTSSENESSDDEYDSDEEGDERLAACALMVDVGSFNDPRDIQGLSHFLEHMIFMGSEKYPQENAYDSHIRKCGGFDNADTKFEETSFYFEVPDEHLDSSIERFVALFVAPLMKKEAMTRERDAVESEFQLSLQEDEHRRDQIISSEFGNPEHPCSIFPWGNAKTLKDNIDDEYLHKCLHEYRKRHYSAHRMYCCVQARLPMEELEQLVVKHFSQIPSNNLAPTDFSAFNNENAFKNEFYENVIFVKPVSNQIKLELCWCLPTLLKEYKTKPHHYLAYLFGYEGVGSLCAYLRNKLWALEMIAGVDDSAFEFNSMFAIFNICIYLTEEGFNHLDEVLAATYSYIKLFEKCGPNKRLFDELKYIEETDFRFQTQRSAFDNVQDLVLNLKYYPPKHILTGPELYFDYDEESIWKLIHYIASNKFNLMITSAHKYNGITYDKVENWFGTEYTSMKMPKNWIDLWNNAEIIPELHFPEPNVFISKDFRILWKDCGSPTLSPYPKKIMDSDVCELWFRQDDKFLLPEAYMYFYFITPLPMESDRNAVLMTLYAHLVKYQLVEQLYPATIAGLNYQYFSSQKGLVLKVNGYNEKLHLIVDIIARAMISIKDKITEEQLEVFKKHQQKDYYNSLIKPKSLNKDLRLQILENIRWPMHQKYNLLKEITLDEIKEFAGNLLKEMKIQSIIQGNLTEETAHNVMNSILRNFNCCRIKDTKLIESRTCQIPLGSNYLICKSFNENDVNTVITNFYQMGSCTLRTECLLDLLMMFVEEPLFDILRTKEQLGYDVSSCVRNNFGILSYSITVSSQEDKFDYNHVQERIEAFRAKMMEILNEMDNDEFEHVRESLIKTKQVSDNELKDEVSRNWGEITCDEYIFDRLKREIECIKTITKENIIQFCLDKEKNNFRKISVQVIGNKEAGARNISDSNECNNSPLRDSVELKILNDEKSTIKNVKEFKETLFVYPVTKTILDSPTSGQMSAEIIQNISNC